MQEHIGAFAMSLKWIEEPFLGCSSSVICKLSLLVYEDKTHVFDIAVIRPYGFDL
jgi:hypothetical protein